MKMLARIVAYISFSHFTYTTQCLTGYITHFTTHVSHAPTHITLFHSDARTLAVRAPGPVAGVGLELGACLVRE